jgi:hypothetical protein
MGINTKAAQDLIFEEYKRAVVNHPSLHSAHEGFAVLLEEMDELKAEIWKKKDQRDKNNMRREAAQVGAMALRFLTDICGYQKAPKGDS